MSAAGTTSRIDEIRARLAAVNWRARTQTDRDIEYLLVIIAEGEDRFARISARECEHANTPGAVHCRSDQPCSGCALRQAEEERDHNAQGWRDAQELLLSVNRPCRRCELGRCPGGCLCPCHKETPLDPDATYQPQGHEYQVRPASYPPPPPLPRARPR